MRADCSFQGSGVGSWDRSGAHLLAIVHMHTEFPEQRGLLELDRGSGCSLFAAILAGVLPAELVVDTAQLVHSELDTAAAEVQPEVRVGRAARAEDDTPEILADAGGKWYMRHLPLAGWCCIEGHMRYSASPGDMTGLARRRVGRHSDGAAETAR